MSDLQERRDRLLLDRIAAARRAGDQHAALRATSDLLAPYTIAIHRRAVSRLRSSPTRVHDTEDVAAAAIERLVRLLRTRCDFGDMPFAAIVVRNVDWQVSDYWQTYLRRGAHEELREPMDMPYGAQEPTSHLDACGDAATILDAAKLSRLERTIAIERAVLDRDPVQVARRRAMRRGAVDMAYSRALAKLRRTTATS